MPQRKTSTYGFAAASKLLAPSIRKAGESRGFAQSKVLTHWAEIVGQDIAGITRPVEVRYQRGAMGAILVLLTTGANAPLVQMRREEIRDRVNATYGYNAIGQVRITQTSATGFSEGQVDFTHRKGIAAPPRPDPEVVIKARHSAEGVSDKGLRSALERLAANVISKRKAGH